MKSDAAATRYTSTGIEFSDNSTLDADVIVFCRGFETNLRKTAAKIVGNEIADKLEDFFGVD